MGGLRAWHNIGYEGLSHLTSGKSLMNEVHQFLAYVRQVLDTDPTLCPCADPRQAGAMLGFLSGLAASYDFERQSALAAAETARNVHRAAFADGLRDQLRGTGNGNARND